MYAKVFASLWEGSMVGQADAQLVFVFLLAHADVDGNVEKTQEVVAALTGLPVERVNEALAVLCAPDARSRTRVEEGRRLMPLDAERGWGWHVVNYRQYRAYIDADTRRAADRERQRRCRGSQVVAPCDVSRPVTAGHGGSRQGEGEEEVEGEAVTASSLRSEAAAERSAEPTLPGMESVEGSESGGEGAAESSGRPSGSSACGRTGSSAGVGRREAAVGPVRAGAEFGLPLTDGTGWEATAEQVEAWGVAYPGVDLRRQFAKMRAWLVSNPSQGKTRRGVAAFVNRWLAGEQDRGVGRNAPAGRRAGADARYLAANPSLLANANRRGTGG